MSDIEVTSEMIAAGVDWLDRMLPRIEFDPARIAKGVYCAIDYQRVEELEYAHSPDFDYFRRMGGAALKERREFHKERARKRAAGADDAGIRAITPEMIMVGVQYWNSQINAGCGPSPEGLYRAMEHARISQSGTIARDRKMLNKLMRRFFYRH